MVRDVLTRDAAKLLESFHDGYETVFPVLSVSARLTPSEARRAADELQGKGYIELNEPFVTLTPSGHKLRSTRNYEVARSEQSGFSLSEVLEELERKIEKL